MHLRRLITYICTVVNAEVAQLVELQPSKLVVASSSLVFRSKISIVKVEIFFWRSLSVALFAISFVRSSQKDTASIANAETLRCALETFAALHFGDVRCAHLGDASLRCAIETPFGL